MESFTAKFSDNQTHLIRNAMKIRRSKSKMSFIKEAVSTYATMLIVSNELKKSTLGKKLKENNELVQSIGAKELEKFLTTEEDLEKFFNIIQDTEKMRKAIIKKKKPGRPKISKNRGRPKI